MKAGASIRKMEKFFFGRYDVHIPWILGSKLTETNEYQSRKHLFGTDKKMRHHEVQREYTEIVKDQFEPEIIEVPDQPTGEHISYLPHKPVVRQNALITKVRTVFDASAKPHPLVSSVNVCMYTGLPLQSLLWDIMVTRLAVGEYQAGFLIDQNLTKSEPRVPANVPNVPSTLARASLVYYLSSGYPAPSTGLQNIMDVHMSIINFAAELRPDKIHFLSLPFL